MRLPVRSLTSLAVAGALLFAACGSDGTPGASTVTQPPTTTAVDGHVAKPASAEPSVSAKMICDDEVKDDLTALLGVKPIAPVKPTWNDHIYSCTYKYEGGQLTLSVKELEDQAATDAYYASLAKDLGKTQDINGLSQGGAFTTANKSAVVRKDYKVLTVDISKLPPQFGNPPDSRENIALNVASAIMGCWTGA